VMDWLRLYVEIIDDPKMKKMSDKTFKIFIFLLCFARELDESGAINKPFCDIAWRIRIKEQALKDAANDLSKLGIISFNTQQIQFLNWCKFQYKSDNVTERVQRFRKRSSNVTSNVIEQNRTEQNRADTPDGPFELPSKEVITEASEIKIKEDIEKVTKQLYDEKIFIKVHAFKNLALKNKKNVRSILHTLTRCYISKPSEPWGYCLKTIGLEHLNYNERDHVKNSQ
jgi:hypothetical protein